MKVTKISRRIQSRTDAYLVEMLPQRSICFTVISKKVMITRCHKGKAEELIYFLSGPSPVLNQHPCCLPLTSSSPNSKPPFVWTDILTLISSKNSNCRYYISVFLTTLSLGWSCLLLLISPAYQMVNSLRKPFDHTLLCFEEYSIGEYSFVK